MPVRTLAEEPGQLLIKSDITEKAVGHVHDARHLGLLHVHCKGLVRARLGNVSVNDTDRTIISLTSCFRNVKIATACNIRDESPAMVLTSGVSKVTATMRPSRLS